MVLGFISLTLVFSQYYIAGICIPTDVANTLLPCPAVHKEDKTEEHRRRLLWHERRILAGAEPKCDDVSHKVVYGVHNNKCNCINMSDSKNHFAEVLLVLVNYPFLELIGGRLIVFFKLRQSVIMHKPLKMFVA